MSASQTPLHCMGVRFSSPSLPGDSELGSLSRPNNWALGSPSLPGRCAERRRKFAATITCTYISARASAGRTRSLLYTLYLCMYTSSLHSVTIKAAHVGAIYSQSSTVAELHSRRNINPLNNFAKCLVRLSPRL